MNTNIIIELESTHAKPSVISASFDAEWLAKEIMKLEYNEKGQQRLVSDDYRVVRVTCAQVTP